MKMRNFYTLCLCCTVFAGQVLAADPVYLPKVAYRGTDQQEKIEYTYDRYGHTTSQKTYYKSGGEFIPGMTITYEYHQLPNGQFVETKREYSESQRSSAAYDDKGMELWSQMEYYDAENSKWVLDSRTEVVLNALGIRTGINEYNPETGKMELSSLFTFDGAGRVTKVTWDEDEVIRYTWGDRLDDLTTMEAEVDGERVKYQNFDIVLNMEYFDPYSLSPTDIDRNDLGEGLYAWEDYKLQTLLVNADITYGSMKGTMRVVLDDEGGFTQTITIGGSEMSRIDFKKLANGGWSEVENAQGEREEATKEYNKYGALTRYYDYGSWYEGDEVIPHEEIYNREYDTEGRPTKTTYFSNGQEMHVEVYEEWTAIDPTGISEIKVQPSLAIYPNPATDYIVIDNVPEGAMVSISDLSGRTVYKQQAAGVQETISVSSLVNGLYLVTLYTGNDQTVGKFVKK